jgi:hypothetical protein
VNQENIYEPERLAGPAGALWLDRVGAFEGVRAAFTTVETLNHPPVAGFPGPVRDPDGSIDEEYVARLAATVGFAYGRLATCRQVHGTDVRRVAEAERRWYDACDGLVTETPGAPLAVFTADCVPIVMWAPVAGTLAVLHAGWRGTLEKIVAAGVSAMAENPAARPQEIMVFLGPAVGPCCYPVGEDVCRAANDAFGRRAGQVLIEDAGRVCLDLYRANDLAAQEAGVLPENVYGVAACTSCRSDLFASYRREGDAAGRMMAVASIEDETRPRPEGDA